VIYVHSDSDAAREHLESPRGGARRRHGTGDVESKFIFVHRVFSSTSCQIDLYRFLCRRRYIALCTILEYFKTTEVYLHV
jgi:hypothetical protein